MKFLLVDDDEDDRFLLEKMIKDAGIKAEFVHAEKACEGIEEANAQKPELIFLDKNIPDMDGLDACREIRKISDYDPVIYIYTGQLEGNMFDLAMEAGADEIFLKERTSDSLIEILKMYHNPSV